MEWISREWGSSIVNPTNLQTPRVRDSAIKLKVGQNLSLIVEIKT